MTTRQLDQDELRAAVAEIVERHGVPGVAVGVVSGADRAVVGVGVTNAETCWSSIEPCTTSTSVFSSKVAFHAAIIFGFTSTRITRTSMGSPSQTVNSTRVSSRCWLWR